MPQYGGVRSQVLNTNTFFFFRQQRSKAVNILWLCSTQPAISKPPSPCWHQCNWHSPIALLAFKNLLQLALLLGLTGSCVWAKTRRMYLQREMYSWNIFSAFPIKEPKDLWVGDNYSVIEENKSNCTMCLASSDHRWELQSNPLSTASCKERLCALQAPELILLGQERYITGVLHSPCNVPGPKSRCYSETLPPKRREEQLKPFSFTMQR